MEEEKSKTMVDCGMPGQRESRIVKLPSGLVFYPDKRFISRLEKLNWMTVLQYQLLKGNG